MYHLIRHHLLASGFRAALVLLYLFSLLHFFQVNGDLIDLAGEFIWRRDPIVLNDRCLSVLPHIGTLLYREYHTLRVFDPALGNFVAIDEERPRTALADAAALIGELIADGRFADR